MSTAVQTITPLLLKRWLDSNTAVRILDIREIHEVSISKLTDFNIPMAFCLSRHAEIPRDLPVVIYCRSGARSAAAVSALQTKYGFENLSSLRGGITAWSKEIEPEMEIA
jgi:adenylyltransferase/sulfurtransferase|tara:strand:- start:3250 stop:3579 length:330 start_codon:yes stop_codon:yes gene_type:complete